jgi:hypothetical protein
VTATKEKSELEGEFSSPKQVHRLHTSKINDIIAETVNQSFYLVGSPYATEMINVQEIGNR